MPGAIRYTLAMDPPSDVIRDFHITDAEYVASSPIADVWKVRHSGRWAALKVYKDRNALNEAVGFDLLKACNGIGCAEVYFFCNGIAIIEWLDGPSLGEMSRSGLDAEACQMLIAAAQKLHGAIAQTNVSLPTVDSVLADFMKLKFKPDCPNRTRLAFTRCKAIASNLIATQHDRRPLHGDLHGDNVRVSPRGPLCFDAKGIQGEYAFEIASALVNPTDRPDIVRTVPRALTVATEWARVCGVSRQRVLEWAVIKAAFMVRWTQDRELDHTYDSDAVHFFLGLLDGEHN